MSSMRPNRQRGFGLVLAVFILTALAALGVYILTVSGVQHQTTVLTLQHARALNVARSGIEWGSYEALKNDACPATTTITPNAPTLSAFAVEVSCTESMHRIRGENIKVYVIDATARAGMSGSPDYVARHVRSVIGERL